jgi:glycosyltransferase involved in cell wall biosynthesis
MLPEIRGRDSVIPNGLPVPRVAHKSLPRDPHVLLVASRLVEQKGIGTALSAFAQVCRRRSDVRLVIAGDGPLRGDLVTMSERLDIEDKVDFIGWVDPGSVPDLINKATAVLIPSEHESFGLSALEAMRMARPVVASCVDGLPEIVEHGVTGLLFNPGDSAEMAENIEGLLGNPDLAESMGQAGRERALRAYSSATMGDRFAALYERLTSQTTGLN